MNNQEAIALLRNLEDSLDSYCELNEDGKKAFHMAIESLELFGNSEQLPSAQPERMTGEIAKDTNVPSTDYVSRRAAIEELLNMLNLDYLDGYKYLEKLKQLPAAQPEIIRCKDCKHWREGTTFSYCDKLYGMGVLDALDYMVAEDDYCSMAERREE